MTARPAPMLWCALALAAVGAALLVAGSHLVAGTHRESRPDRSQEQPPAVAGPMLRVRAPTADAGSPGPQAATPPLPVAVPQPGIGDAVAADPLAGPVPDSFVQDLLDASGPTGAPALPANTRAVLVETATRVLIADLTGTGRDDFPSFWSGPAHTIWTGVRVQASSVQADWATAPTSATVTLVWAGTSPTGERVERRLSVITLERSGTRWQPVSVG